MLNFTDYTKSVQSGYTMGYASLFFRRFNDNQSSILENWDRAFVCNSKDDGWFRKINGNADGYGLALVWIELGGKKPLVRGDFLLYKVKVTYQSWEDETKFETELMWLALHKDFTYAQVKQYCLENSHNWRA